MRTSASTLRRSVSRPGAPSHAAARHQKRTIATPPPRHMVPVLRQQASLELRTQMRPPLVVAASTTSTAHLAAARPQAGFVARPFCSAAAELSSSVGASFAREGETMDGIAEQESTSSNTQNGLNVPAAWRSNVIYHDHGVMTAYNCICQALGSKPEEENRKLADEFFFQIKCLDQTFEGRSRNKRTARKEAVKQLLSGLQHQFTQDQLDTICLTTAQKLILDQSKTGANSLNVKFSTVNADDMTAKPEVTAEVAIGGVEASGVGDTEKAARLVAFDQLIEKMMMSSGAFGINPAGGAEGGDASSKAPPQPKSSSALRAASMISRHNTVAQRMRNNVEFHFEFADEKWTSTVVWSDGEYAEGVHSSKTFAKALAAENMLVKRGVLQRSLTEEELALADSPEGPETLNKLPPQAWDLFLPSLWKESAESCLPFLTQRTPEQGYMPVDLWETLIQDTAARGAREQEENGFRQKNQDVRDLCNCCVEGEFYATGGAEYFHKWRGLLGLEEHAMFDQAADEVENIGPLTVGTLGNWPLFKVEGFASDALHTDDLLLVCGRPCRVTSANPKTQQAMLRLLDPREDDADLFQEGSEIYAAQFGMAVPNERMVRALKSFAGYKPPEYDQVQPMPVSDWLQGMLVNPEGIGFGSEVDHTEKIAEPVPPLVSIPLSESQKAALEAATSRRITLIQGPPGTGKTYCGAAIVSSYVAKTPSARVLACADSNVAADNLCFKIQQLMPGARVVRVGDGGCDELRNQVFENEGRELDVLSMSTAEVREARAQAIRRQLPNAQVVVATCIGSGMDALDVGGSYDLVVIDEASQALEPATLVALERAGQDVKHVVLIGDHKQLPPTVLCNDYQVGVSLFQRLADRGVDPLMLIEQRRMHSLIADFPNKNFYNGRLLNATDDAQLQPVTVQKESNVELVHCAPIDFQGNEVKKGESTCNKYEADKLVKYLQELSQAEPGFDQLTIGILTPYAAQKHLLENLLFDHGLLRENIRIDTIDGFQGMEKDLILFSATRSNARGDLGFLKDPRRMNVMLTRAKKSLVVFADATCLRSSTAGHWPSWVHWVQENAKVSGDELASAFSSSWHNPPRINATEESNDEESDFLKMLRANEQGAKSFQSTTTAATPTAETAEVHRGRPSVKPKDDGAQVELSEAEFEAMMQTDSLPENESAVKNRQTEQESFLKMLDEAARRDTTGGNASSGSSATSSAVAAASAGM
ncbi:unnamed protein product [Amoebophrya sp. A120]|nr:unnamed protein product [Amoebophrya sp. A120]|eukprot:GSA120T00012314001.1